MERYSRQLILNEIGKEGQEKIHNARVLVVGAGGLGSPLLLYLAGAGVGSIGIADNDVVQTHNLHRQVIFQQNHVQSLKNKSAKSQLVALNSDIKVHLHDAIHPSNALEIFQNYDIVVDGTDNFSTRYLVNDACFLLDKVLVSGSVFQWEGQLSVFHYLQNGVFTPNLRDLYPMPPQEALNCSEAGVAGTIVGMIGTMMANEVLKIILGIEPFHSKLLIVNALSMNIRAVKFSKNPENPLNKNWRLLKENYQFGVCNLTGQEISWEDFMKMSKDEVILIDVREYKERELYHKGGIWIPLNELSHVNWGEFSGKKIVFYCESGKRSLKAAHQIGKIHPNSYSIRGGLQQYPKN